MCSIAFMLVELLTWKAAEQNMQLFFFYELVEEKRRSLQMPFYLLFTMDAEVFTIPVQLVSCGITNTAHIFFHK